MSSSEKDRSPNTCSPRRPEDLLRLRDTLVEVGHVLIERSTPVALSGIGYGSASAHTECITRLSPQELLLSSDAPSICVARALEALSHAVSSIDEELDQENTKGDYSG